MNSSLEIANLLLEIGAFEISPHKPFTYASGQKGPIYCDNRKISAYPEKRKIITQHFIDLLGQSRPEAILGLATAGIAPGAFLAHEMNLPFGYIRSKAKEHGKVNQIEGFSKQGARVILVEDLINSASSIKKSIAPICTYFDYQKVLCIVDYQREEANINLESLGLEKISLTNFSILIQAALSKGLISEDDVELVLSWHRSPSTWNHKS